MFAVRDHLSHTALVPAVLCAILPALGLVLLNICTYSKKLGEKMQGKSANTGFTSEGSAP